jgi:TPR repeat protein
LAQNTLGYKYEYGIDVKRNYKISAEWYQKAAEQNNAKAQYNLGAMYANSLGVSQDYVEAYKWFSLAYKNGLKQAQDVLDFLKRHMSPSQIAKASQLARI